MPKLMLTVHYIHTCSCTLCTSVQFAHVHVHVHNMQGQARHLHVSGSAVAGIVSPRFGMWLWKIDLLSFHAQS